MKQDLLKKILRVVAGFVLGFGTFCAVLLVFTVIDSEIMYPLAILLFAPGAVVGVCIYFFTKKQYIVVGGVITGGICAFAYVLYGLSHL